MRITRSLASALLLSVLFINVGCGHANGVVAEPHSVAALSVEDREGVYVTSSRNNVVLVYDEQGRPLAHSGTFPNLDKPISMTWNASIGGAQLVVLNGNGTITAYDPGGHQYPQLGDFPTLTRPNVVAYGQPSQSLNVADLATNTPSMTT